MKNVQLWLAVGLLGLTLACSRGMKDKLFGTEDSSTASETETGTPTAFSSSVDDQLMAGREAPIKIGNSLPLRNIPIGSTVHCIEMKPGKGAQLARAAGASAQLVAREQGHATLRLRSGEMRKVPAECRATIGEVGNSEHSLEKLGKAGASRWRGVRPTVRGAAMNPVDHPHGGGEAKAGQGNPHPVSPWGMPAKGYKTRKNKRTNKFIVRDRRG